MKFLSNVTLSAVDGYGRSKEHLDVIDKCCESITFGKKVLMTTDDNIDSLSKERDDVEFHLIDRMPTRKDYNIFLCSRLTDYITTEYTLYIQEDGYILHPNSWSDEFLNYDYIGVPWLYEDGTPLPFCGSLNDVVGCGGFTLRSKKFMDLSASLNYDGSVNDDVYLCTSRYAKNFMMDSGIKYAPLDVAFRFGTGGAIVESIEKFIELGMVDKNYPPFGFHGVIDEGNYLKFWERKDLY